jgi:SOS-response transcriptional repressor LexA
MLKKDFNKWLDTMPSGDCEIIQDEGNEVIVVAFTGITEHATIKTLKERGTGIVVEVNDTEYDRFFDNRNPFNWDLIGERNA